MVEETRRRNAPRWALEAAVLACAILCATPFLPGAAAATAQKTITGKLSKRGYTVLAVGARGKATSVHVRGTSFKLRPRASRVSLHLRKKDGTYAGPIVVGRLGIRAIVGVKAGARLGRIVIHAGTGYAKTARVRPTRSLDLKWLARAGKGVPIGAGNYGRVRSRGVRGPQGDRDFDGVPDVLDIDDDGDLILDVNESQARSAASPSTSATQPYDTELRLMPNLSLTIDSTVNASIGSTVADADAALVNGGQLLVSELAGDSAELDCRGLIYCSRGGTGRVFGFPVSPQFLPEFPECCDLDDDGFGTITHNPSLPGSKGMFLYHGARSDQITTGDMLIERVTTDGVETQHPALLQYVFASVPALVSYSDTAGNGSTISYPVAKPYAGIGGPGTYNNGLPVAAGLDGNVVVDLTYWRPQRKRIPEEPGTGEWTDIGHLVYAVATGSNNVCSPASYSTSSPPDPNLVPVPEGSEVPGRDQNGNRGGGFIDTANDRPADPANKLSFKLNLTRCFADMGEGFAPGASFALMFRSVPSSGGPVFAWQSVTFKRVS